MKHPLRFCLITTFFPPYSFGGDGVFVAQLANELAGRGHHVEVIHCLDSYNLLARGEKPRTFPMHPDVVVHRLHSPLGGLSPLATQQTGYPLLKTGEIERILAQGFDVIHYHNISLVGGPGLIAMGSAVKLYSTHEYWLVCPMNVLFRYDGVACTEKKCLRCTLAYKRPPQWWRYTDLMTESLRHLDLLIHPTRFCLEQHNSLGYHPPQIVLPYFHTPTQPDPGSETVPPVKVESPYFLYVGRFEALKGAHTLIPLFREYPRANLVLVGEGSQGAELRRLAAGCSNIHFTGWLDHSQLHGLFRNATALLLPSLCFEGAPLVMMEAFLQHTPVIGRDLGSIPEILHSTGGGLTFCDNSTLRARLDEVLDDPVRRNELGERAFAAYRQSFTPGAHLEKYMAIIETLLEKKESAAQLNVGQENRT